YFSIVDRKKDLILCSGYNVYPREVEEVLFMHPAVAEAAAIGVSDAYRGESVKAFVVLKGGMHATEDEIVAFCKERLAAFKVPKAVEFTTDLPKSLVGKVLRPDPPPPDRMGPRAHARGRFARGKPVGRPFHFEWTKGPHSCHFGSIDRRSSAPSDSALGPAESAGGGRRRASDPHLGSSLRRRRSPHPPVHDLPRHDLGRRILPDYRPARHDVHRSDGLERRDVLLSGQRHERRRGRAALKRGIRHSESSGHGAGRTTEPPSQSGGRAGGLDLASAFRRRWV